MRLRFGLLALLATLPVAASAQESATVQTARSAVRASVAARGLVATDLDDLAPSDVRFDRRSGATFVSFSQRINGIDVWATQTPVAVTATGEAVFPATTAFERGVAARANAPTPVLEATGAVVRAEAHVRRLSTAPYLVLTDDPAVDAAALAAREVVYSATAPRLVYQPIEGGALRLAWATTLTGGSQLWAVRVDAATGAVLAADDLVAHDAWGEAAHAPASFVPLAGTAAGAALAAPSSYRVVGMPNESPSHGAFSLVANPADAQASPNGWHDTGAAQYTVTRGNNAYAYLDRDANNAPDAGSSPDGGAGLVFDFPFDPTQGVSGNVNAAVTSVFYWGNIVHDVTWHYGFDEASANFQTNNLGRGGVGNDAVNLEAIDGSGTDNANFSTPADGSAGRMQMYEWTAPPRFEVTAPASIAGSYASAPAQFGPPPPFAGEIVLAGGFTGGPSQACTPAAITGAVAGKIALITRGSCDFVVKVRNAQSRGAIAVIIHNCDVEGTPGCTGANPNEAVITMGAGTVPPTDITIPSAFVALSTGETMAAATGVTVTAARGINRDSDFDAGVIAHEYGHGISNRLIAASSSTSCLGNTEQMGEGWSDYIGLMLTQRPGDTGAQRRGVGTYLQFEGNDGEGIRPAPYSTSFAVNDYTYQDVITGAGGTGTRALTVPHGVGFVWASTMWDLAWNLIEAHGYSPNIYDGAGTAGNQIAINLYATGLKLTACSPGFVSGRDGILAADRLLYPDPNRPGEGRHYSAIWRAFARRGVGVGASQGSTASANDGTASFVLPASVATEATADGGTVSLSLAGPNPFTVATTLALRVDRTQDVRVEMLDLLGRQVAVLHDGPVVAGSALPVRIAAAGLPAGVYVVRASG
ncbi:MAG TPA: M36 family metallopeptidase, partial [Rubricoccaceae bacterium]